MPLSSVNPPQRQCIAHTHKFCNLTACVCVCVYVQEGTRKLPGISRAVVLHVCAQQAQQVQAFKLARWAHTQLQTLRLPPSWQVSQTLSGHHNGCSFASVELHVPQCSAGPACW